MTRAPRVTPNIAIGLTVAAGEHRCPMGFGSLS
jgi:hypothetical protein